MDRILSSQWSQFALIGLLTALIGLAIIFNALTEPGSPVPATPTPAVLGLRPPEPMLVLFDELEEPALKLPNYTVSGAVEATGDPEYGDWSFQVLIEQSDWNAYHVLVVSREAGVEAASEFWVVNGALYVPSAEGGMLRASGSVGPDLNAPGWFYLRILTPEELARLDLVGQEVIDGIEVVHYIDDLSSGVPFDPPEGECFDDLSGRIDLWVATETGLMIRIAGHMRWINCDGHEQTLRYTFTVDQQGTTQDVALQIPTPTPTPRPTPTSTPTATPTPAPGDPVVDRFEVSPAQVPPGGQVTVSWDVRDADRVVIEPVDLIGELQPVEGDPRRFAGERSVAITAPTTFRLIATNAQTGQSIDRVVQVLTVEPTPTPTATNTPSPTPTQPPTATERPEPNMPTATATASATLTATYTATPTATPITPTPTPVTPTPTPTFTPSPSPTEVICATEYGSWQVDPTAVYPGDLIIIYGDGTERAGWQEGQVIEFYLRGDYFDEEFYLGSGTVECIEGRPDLDIVVMIPHDVPPGPAWVYESTTFTAVPIQIIDLVPAPPSNLAIDCIFLYDDLAAARSLLGSCGDALYITWSDNSTNEQGFYLSISGTDGTYEVYYLDANTTEFIFYGFEDFVTYTISLQAYNSAGYSSAATATFPCCSSP